MFENEEWRVIDNFPQYMVSSHGRVKNISHVMARRITINDRGFPVVVLRKPDSSARFLRQVNKLVAEAFIEYPVSSDNGESFAVWHNDGDLTNCHVDNLRWASRSAVLEWNDMHRGHTPFKQTAKVMNNQTGAVYANTYECAMAEGELESRIIWRIESQARSLTDDNAKYKYVFS